MRRRLELSLWFAAAALVLLGLGVLGCAGEAGERAPAETPDAGTVAPPDVTPPDTRVTLPDARVAPDARPGDTYIKVTPDALPRNPDGLPPDARVPVPDVLPPTPDAGYVNQYGWTPYRADGSEAPCCVACGDYDGCLVLIHTTPFCSLTVGSNCFRGGTGSDSVWPTCQKPPAGGCRPWSP